MELNTFLRDYFRAKSPEHHILIWTNPGKRSHWFTDPLAAMDFALRITDRNVYFGMGMTNQSYPPHKRTSSDNTVAIASVWIDIDIEGPGHRASNNTLPSREIALQLLDALPLSPTVVIDSGGGLHAHWALDELFVCTDNTQKAAAVALTSGWQAMIKRKANEICGRSLDSTHDLARVLRLPGTLNLKPEWATPPPVTLLTADWGVTYSVADLEEYVDTSAAPVALFTATDYQSMRDGIDFSPTQELSHTRFEDLCDVEPRFKASWERTRRDMKDNTASAYDLSLANYAAQAGWSDQEIVALLIENHRRYNEKKKTDQYYLRTITLARQSVERKRAQEEVEEYVVLNGPASGQPAGEVCEGDSMDAEVRQKNLDNLSTLLGGIVVTDVVKYLADPPTYRLVTQHSAIMLPSVEHLISQTKLRTAIAATTGHLIDPIKPAQWQIDAQLLLRCCRLQDVGKEATDAGQVEEWVKAYLAKRRPVDNVQEAKEARRPYTHDGAIYLFLSDFIAWLYLEFGEKISAKALGPRMTVWGAKSTTVWLKNEAGGSRGTTTTVWKLPDLDLY